MGLYNFSYIGDKLELIQREAIEGRYKHLHLRIYGKCFVHKKEIFIIKSTEATAAPG